MTIVDAVKDFIVPTQNEIFRKRIRRKINGTDHNQVYYRQITKVLRAKVSVNTDRNFKKTFKRVDSDTTNNKSKEDSRPYTKK